MSTTLDSLTALRELGVTEDTLTAEEKRRLDEDGYLALPGILDLSQLKAIRARLEELLTLERENAGREVHQEEGTARLANLVDKGDCFRVFFTHPRVLAALAHVLGGEMKLSSLNSRAALPGQGLQALHADWGQVVEPGQYQVCNSIWLLDDFTQENGPTRVVPGSHRSGKLPGQAMADPKAAHPAERLVLAPAGTVVVFNSHTWHGGTLNRTAAPRRAVHSYWTRRDQPQQLNQRQFLSAETRQSLSPTIRYLLDVMD
ncbi:MAG TPA: phytanoyl-CoA dioxygenase family protein [Candidatus Methylacidiphilales bacterium]|jgi:ectoine hydroxylase-related dioxygenase (phytanoyl-CoA dioxygenase family)|nr:phytanoyl-CoA dioxygenase family protein [Candidatus Methylacidiphilales bacterium]